jgi:hypothetical protein
LRFVKDKIQDIGYLKRKKPTRTGFPHGLFDCPFGKNRKVGLLCRVVTVQVQRSELKGSRSEFHVAVKV